MPQKDRPSLMSISGRNAFWALVVGLIANLALLIFVLIIRAAMDFAENRPMDVWLVITGFGESFATIGICVVPIVFLLTFALLQRIKLPW